MISFLASLFKPKKKPQRKARHQAVNRGTDFATGQPQATAPLSTLDSFEASRGHGSCSHRDHSRYDSDSGSSSSDSGSSDSGSGDSGGGCD